MLVFFVYEIILKQLLMPNHHGNGERIYDLGAHWPNTRSFYKGI